MLGEFVLQFILVRCFCIAYVTHVGAFSLSICDHVVRGVIVGNSLLASRLLLPVLVACSEAAWGSFDKVQVEIEIEIVAGLLPFPEQLYFHLSSRGCTLKFYSIHHEKHHPATNLSTLRPPSCHSTSDSPHSIYPHSRGNRVAYLHVGGRAKVLLSFPVHRQV